MLYVEICSVKWGWMSFCFADQANFRFFIQLDGKRCHTWVDRPWSEAFLASGAMSGHMGSYPKFCLNLVFFVAFLAISGEEDPTADSNHRCQMYFGQTKIWLVVWNMAFIFPYIGNSNPNWLSYFSEGLKPPTTYCLCWIMKKHVFKHLILIWFAVALAIQHTATLIVNNIMFALFSTNI